MRKLLAIILAMLFLLAGCGQASQQQEEAAASPEDSVYVEEQEIEGTVIKYYYEGGKDGRLVRSEYVMPDGSTGEEEYSADGKMAHMIYRGADGYAYEDFFYPNGTVSKSLVTNPDGSYSEYHYADNGHVDEETNTYYSGTMTYQKDVAADGTVLYEKSVELKYEEDGSYWTIETYDNGAVSECHYSAEGVLLEDKYTDPDNTMISESTYADGVLVHSTYHDLTNGVQTETEYYPDGTPMKMRVTHSDSDAYSTSEYYENGYLKYEYYLYEDGTVNEDKANEAGYLVYSHYVSGEGDYEYEYFADDEGNLVKYVENGTVREGSAIESWVVENFQSMQDNTQYRHIQPYTE